MAATNAEIRALFDTQCGAIRRRDLDVLMSLYAPDIVYFDVVPPLRYDGAAALRARFLEWFDGYQSGTVVVGHFCASHDPAFRGPPARTKPRHCWLSPVLDRKSVV